MKKIVTLTAAALLISALLIPTAFAQTPDYGDWFNQMFQWHEQWVDEAVEKGQMSEGQAEAWKDHFNYMRDFHSQYPMGMMMGGYGMMGPGYGYGEDADGYGTMGPGYGMGGYGGAMGSGYGMGGYGGMMGGNGYGPNNAN